MTMIISGFPGVGKSYFKNNVKGLKVLDSDSSNFSWVKDSEGNNTKERNPEFPNNYIKHIKDNIDNADIIMVSSHKIVRDALKENNIMYCLVYPDKNLKDEFIERYKNRGNDQGFITMINNNWDIFINEMEDENFPTKIILKNKEDYMFKVVKQQFNGDFLLIQK